MTVLLSLEHSHERNFMAVIATPIGSHYFLGDSCYEELLCIFPVWLAAYILSHKKLDPTQQSDTQTSGHHPVPVHSILALPIIHNARKPLLPHQHHILLHLPPTQRRITVTVLRNTAARRQSGSYLFLCHFDNDRAGGGRGGRGTRAASRLEGRQ